MRNPSLDSRVTHGYTVDLEGSRMASRDWSARGQRRHDGGGPPRRFRSRYHSCVHSRSRSASRSRSKSRSRSSSCGRPDVESVSANASVFNISRSASREVRKWVVKAIVKMTRNPP